MDCGLISPRAGCLFLGLFCYWSVFRQPVRTNNDVEGWLCRLNDKPSHGQLNLQVDSVAVRAEAALVQLNVHLLSEGRAMRLQRKSFAALHSRE